MKKLSASQLNDFLAAISAGQDLYLPVDNQTGAAEFKKWTPGTVPSSKLNTVRSAKDFFFPQMENVVTFKMEGKAIDVIDERREADDFVVFGARACDVKSFSILDSVYLVNPVDSFYKTRREHGTVISFACSRPESTCFCTLFGIDPTEASPGSDVAAWLTAGDYYFEAVTEKGKALLAKAGSLLQDAEGKAVDAQKAETKKVLEKLPFARLKKDKFTHEHLMELFNSPKWAGLSESCLACGTCTFVCPTCQCYDVRDFDTGHGVKRYRCWDSCMYSDFTKMAHGNPRLTQVERFRQRFMHKLVYYPSNNNGTYGCVGCGRCLSKCPVSMNIVKVMKALGEDQ